MARPGSGNEGEAMVLAALVCRRYEVLIPFGEGQPYDLAVHLGDRDLLRVQYKTAWPRQGCIVFNSRTTDHGRGRQSYRGLADVFGVYFPPTGSVYLVPIDAVAEFAGRLRLTPTRNNQKRGIRFAADFEIDRWSLDSLRELALRVPGEDEPLATVA
jgi:PD-(D/E)XK endonuclease